MRRHVLGALGAAALALLAAEPTAGAESDARATKVADDVMRALEIGRAHV